MSPIVIMRAQTVLFLLPFCFDHGKSRPIWTATTTTTTTVERPPMPSVLWTGVEDFGWCRHANG